MWLSIPASLAIKGAEIRSGIPMSGMFFKIPFRTCIARIDGIERIVSGEGNIRQSHTAKSIFDLPQPLEDS